ncbi:uncharacterized protein LAESUDRAFT_813967 [Laetiporus sulphureus 93-53]|uniref:Oxidase ustYa n=1 Tax=Laetiporus sulphureus 93-53 TaxID=1314785 RepID=A0A165DCZ4_9APHY|nr:uncharacterized protein LAESUDRAFT_813967 [Laetiporus sulphureus 93-53]KZT04598.1 hypothetical protein LAESUDRAFT_813967 [Laetiporus sulphureus 93-53]
MVHTLAKASCLQNRTEFWLFFAFFSAISALAVPIVTVAYSPSWAREPQARSTRNEYTYEGADYPPTWDIASYDPVHMTLAATSHHYALDTPHGIAAWNSTLPENRGLLYLGPEQRIFSISMFHQLRCLDIIRASLAVRLANRASYAETPSALDHHCMNYLRQMVSCRANDNLEPIAELKRDGSTRWEVIHVCHDWTAVYNATMENYEDHLKATGG